MLTYTVNVSYIRLAVHMSIPLRRDAYVYVCRYISTFAYNLIFLRLLVCLVKSQSLKVYGVYELLKIIMCLLTRSLLFTGHMS